MPDRERSAAATARAELRRAVERVRRDARLSRGYGARALVPLLARLGREEPLDALDESGLAAVLESLLYALDDARAEADRNLRVTSRTITHAVRRGGAP